MEVTDSFSISTRTYFSTQHIRSAAFLCRQAYSIEKDYSGEFDDEIFSNHRAYVTGAILSSVFYLEASINELFSDTVEDTSWLRGDELNSETSKLMATMWNNGVPRTASYSILDKFQIALALSRKELLNKGNQPCQDVKSLISLRNSLVHFEPEWTKLSGSDDFNQDDIHKYEKLLKGKFQLNPLAKEGNAFYPDRCLGHGSAEWAIESTIKFTDMFYSKMDLNIPYEYIRAKLSTK
jgi:hypothetical protein